MGIMYTISFLIVVVHIACNQISDCLIVRTHLDQLQKLALHSSEEGFHQCVVLAVPSPGHGLHKAVVFKQCLECGGQILATDQMYRVHPDDSVRCDAGPSYGDMILLMKKV